MMRMILAALMGMMVAGAAQAQVNTNQNKPLEITADQTLEWHRNDQRYIARGNAVAAQGDVSIKAETLTADYRDSAKSSMDIHRLTAEGGVTIESQGNVATGQKAVYEVDSGMAVMTGDNLKLTSPDQVVTAQERFEYNVPTGKLSAKGGAVVTRMQDKLAADSVSATFADDPVTKERKLKELTADGNVVITTPTETVRGQNGVYDAATNIATLSGGVRIERGPNVLEGDKAEVNLTTNVSRIIGGSTTDGGRVRGVFYPGSTDGNVVAPAPVPEPVTIVPQEAPVPQTQEPIQLTPPPAPQAQDPIQLTPPPVRQRMTGP